MINGIIFQKNNCKEYKGVEGDNWYLNDLYPDTLGEYFNDNIEKSWFNSDHLDVCSDISFINMYIELSRSNNIDFRMLLCETEKKYPKMNEILWDIKFIGYDYAYMGGSYYSAILNDICSRRIDKFATIKLNDYGLFDELQQIKEFIISRDIYAQENKENVIEQGDFIIYKLYEIYFDNF